MKSSNELELIDLRQLANRKSKLRLAAQRALTHAEVLNRKNRLGDIKIDNDRRHVHVYEKGGQLFHTGKAD